MYSHINPYATWSNSNVRSAVPDVPSVHGALPFAAQSSSVSSNALIFYFTAFEPSILNCTVIGQNTFPYFKITTDASLSGYTVIKNTDGKPVALIEWKERPLVEIRNVFSKQSVSNWLSLSEDASHRIMKVKGKRYIWVPQNSTICLYPAGKPNQELLARITRSEDGTVALEITSNAVTVGLLETCVVATVLLQCGHKID
ncbi:hypothetical protein C8R45DRAFT_838113 [Mycena sanguinolenta]|nr:hypothetical protein C8R45DRAFT_838113 [Mycena sanguinolenta]